MEDAWYPHGLVDTGSYALPPPPRNTLPCRKHHRPFSLCPCRFPCKVTVGWHYLHVSRCQGRGDRGTICSQLSLLCRLIVYGGRDPSGGEVYPENTRMEHGLPKPYSFPSP